MFVRCVCRVVGVCLGVCKCFCACAICVVCDMCVLVCKYTVYKSASVKGGGTTSVGHVGDARILRSRTERGSARAKVKNAHAQLCPTNRIVLLVDLLLGIPPDAVQICSVSLSCTFHIQSSEMLLGAP